MRDVHDMGERERDRERERVTHGKPKGILKYET